MISKRKFQSAAERDADCRLYAAAPELLDMVKMLLPAHRQGDCYSNDYRGLCICGRDKALALILKIEGQNEK